MQQPMYELDGASWLIKPGRGGKNNETMKYENEAQKIQVVKRVKLYQKAEEETQQLNCEYGTMDMKQ